jgi:hypothetical protein
MHLIVEATFVETHMVGVRHKPMRLWCAMIEKEINDFEIEENAYDKRRREVEFRCQVNRTSYQKQGGL